MTTRLERAREAGGGPRRARDRWQISWYSAPMRTAIDRAGRIVVPKALRDALGLTPGQPLDITVRDGRLEVEPVPTPMHLERRGKRIVAVPDTEVPPLTADTVRDALERVRR